MTTTDELPTVYTRSAVLALWGVRARKWGKALLRSPIVLLGLIGVACGRIRGIVGSSSQAILITAGCCCMPAAIGGLAGPWFGVLAAGPTLWVLAWAVGGD